MFSRSLHWLHNGGMKKEGKILARNVLAGVLLCFCLLLAACGSSEAPGHGTAASYEVTDIQGTVVSLPEKPHRILTLSMSTDEVMLGLVPPEDMAAVDALLDDPVSSNVVGLAEKVPNRIGRPTVEGIMALSPDLVIVPDWGDLSLVPSLREAGLKVVVCKGARNLEEIRETVVLLAQAAGVPERGERLLAMMDARLKDIKQKVDAIPEKERKTVVLISLMQGYGGIGSTFDEACRYAGVKNGRAVLGIRDGQVMTKEQLVQIDPDILFLPTYNNHGNFDVEKFRREYLDDPALQTLKAIRGRNLLEPTEAYIYNSSQDFVLGVQEIAYRAYGDAFRQGRDEHLSAVD